MRKTRAGMPASSPSVQPMNGRASFDTSMPPSFSSTFRAFGPTTAICAYCSVTFDGEDLPVPPFGLEPFLHVGVDAVGAAGGGVAEERVLREPRHDPVIHQEAVLGAHQPVAAARRPSASTSCWCRACRGSAPASGPFTMILPRVEASSSPTMSRTFSDLADHGVLLALAGARVAVGPSPVADRFPGGAVLLVPVVQRRAADRLEQIPPAPRRRWSPSRSACRAGGRWWCRPAGSASPECLRQDRQAVDVAELPLICGHAERGVALGVLDADEALLRGELDVRHLHVVLEVEQHLGAELRPARCRHHPDRARSGASSRAVPRSRGGRPLSDACAPESQLAPDIAEHVRRPRRRRRPTPVPSAPVAGARESGRRSRAPRPRSACRRMRPEMHDRRPAARHRDRVAGDLARRHVPLAAAGCRSRPARPACRP